MDFARQHHYQQVPAIGQRIQGRILQARADFERAPACFEQSLAALAALDDAVELARTQEAYGLFFQARNRAGDQERGAALLQEARATFARLGVRG
jgi:hypothetical protein